MFRRKKNKIDDIPDTNTKKTLKTRKNRHPIRHGVFLAVLYVIAYYAASIGILLVLEPFLGGLTDFLMQIVFRLPLGCVLYKKLRATVREGDPVRLSRMQVLAMLAAHLVLFALPVKLAHKNLFMSVSDASAAGSLVYLANLCVVAPIVEELVFRGAYFPLIRKNLPFWPAAIVNGLVFGLAHFSNLGNMISAGLLGVTASMLYEATGTIRYGLYLHLLFNCVGIPMVLMGLSLPAAVSTPLYFAAVTIQLVAYLNHGRIARRLSA